MRSSLATLLLPSLLLAQQAPDPYRYVPENAFAVLRMQGGKQLQGSFSGTSIGKVLAEPAVRAALLELWRALPEQFELEPAALRRFDAVIDAAAEFEGELVVAVTTPTPVAKTPGRPREYDVTASLQLIGSAEQRSALDRALRELMTEEGTELRVEGESIRMHGSGRTRWSEPLQRDGSTLLLLSTEPESGIASCLTPRTGGFVGEQSLSGAALGLQIDLGAFIERMLAAEADDDDPTTQRMHMLARMCGISSLNRFVYTVRADGKWLAQDMGITFRDGDLGLLGALLPGRTDPSRLLALLPPDTANWSTWRFDPERMHRFWIEATTRFADQLPMSREELEAAFTKATKLRLHEDLLALLGDEWLRIDAIEDAMVVDDEEGDERLDKIDQRFGASVFVVGLRDGATMATNVEKMVRARGLHAARKTEQYGDTKIHRLTLLGSLPIEYAFAGDTVVLGIGQGEDTQRNLRSVLDAAARHAKEPRAAEPPPALAARMVGWPAGAGAFDSASMLEVLDGLNSLGAAMAGELAAADVEMADMGIMHQLLQLSAALRPAIGKHGGDLTVTAWWFDADRITSRSRW